MMVNISMDTSKLQDDVDKILKEIKYIEELEEKYSWMDVEATICYKCLVDWIVDNLEVIEKKVYGDGKIEKLIYEIGINTK